MDTFQLRTRLDALHARLNRREYVSPDPLEAVYRFDNPRDREVAGLIAACLAYGRVAQILRNLHALLDALGPAPADRIRRSGAMALGRAQWFRHRWTDANEMAALLDGICRALRRHGSIEACFLSHHSPAAPHTLGALTGFARELRGGDPPTSLLAAPEKGSACKRLHLFLRWMIRRDDVDPGCWRGVTPEVLLIPLDTHMHRIARALGMTKRKQANLATVIEVTESFREINPSDPLKYDFALTRLGIRGDQDPKEFLLDCGVSAAGARSLQNATPNASTRPAPSRRPTSPRP